LRSRATARRRLWQRSGIEGNIMHRQKFWGGGGGVGGGGVTWGNAEGGGGGVGDRGGSMWGTERLTDPGGRVVEGAQT